MTLKQIQIAVLAATFVTGATALSYAQSSGASGSASGKAKIGASSGKTSSSATVGAGGSVRSNSGDTKLKGLDRADEVAGEHGAQGRANARVKNKNY